MIRRIFTRSRRRPLNVTREEFRRVQVTTRTGARQLGPDSEPVRAQVILEQYNNEAPFVRAEIHLPAATLNARNARQLARGIERLADWASDQSEHLRDEAQAGIDRKLHHQVARAMADAVGWNQGIHPGAAVYRRGRRHAMNQRLYTVGEAFVLADQAGAAAMVPVQIQNLQGTPLSTEHMPIDDLQLLEPNIDFYGAATATEANPPDPPAKASEPDAAPTGAPLCEESAS